MPPHASRLYRVDPAAFCAGRAGDLVVWPAAAVGSAVLGPAPRGEPDSAAERYALWVRTDAGISSGLRVTAEDGWRLNAAEGGPQIAVTRLSVPAGGAAGVYALTDRPLAAGARYRVARREVAPRDWPVAPAPTPRLADGPARSPGAVPLAAVCFLVGTRIATARGSIPVERLLPGTRVVTRDNGLQPVRWVSSQSAVDTPIRLAGDDRPLNVSPEHRILLAGAEARTRFGQSEVLVPARCLVGRDGITALSPRALTYVHFALDRHEIVYAEGQPAESFRPHARVLETLPDREREALFELLPALRSDPDGYGPAARPCVTFGRVRAAA